MFASLFGSDDSASKSKDATDTSSASIDVVQEASKMFGSFFDMAKSVGETVGQSVKDNAANVNVTEMPLMGDFMKEQNKFISQKKASAGGTALPPWFENEEVLKEPILALSKDKRNFLRDPPAGQTSFKFDFDGEFPTAMVMLQEDPNLEKMRFTMVPKELSEEVFWRNYFYRVYLVKQSFEVSALAHEADDEGSAVDNDDVTIPARGGDRDAFDARGSVSAGNNASDNDLPDDDDDDLDAVADHLEVVGLAGEDAHHDHSDAGGSTSAAVNLDELDGKSADDRSASGGSRDAASDVMPGAASATDSDGDAERPPSSKSDQGVSSDNSWEKDMDADLEAELEEFELLKDGNGDGDEELDDGWEDEVAEMLKNEE